MKVKKSYIIDRIQYYFFLIFPLSVVLFNPSKEFLGVLSITDLFVAFSLIVFIIYEGITLTKISNKAILLIILAIFSFLSLIINDGFEFLQSIKYQLRWGFYIGVFLMVYNYFNTLSSIEYFKKGLYRATYLVCITAILQSVFKEQMIPTIFWIHDFPHYINITFRAVGTFDNPLNLCGFLVFPLGFIQFSENKKTKDKLLNILIYTTLIFTASKIAFIIVLISILIYFKKHLKIIIYGFISLIITIIIFFSLPKSILEDYYIYQRFNNQKMIDMSIDTRLYMLNTSMKLIKENPVFGIGYDNYEKRYYDLERNDTNLNLNSSSFTSESFLLDFYLDNGLIPFLIIFILLLESVLLFFSTKTILVKQFTYPQILFIIMGLVMSARAVPLMYLLITFLAITNKIQIEQNTQIINNNS